MVHWFAVIKMKKRVMGFSALLLCTMIWGTAFIAQSVGMEQMGPFTFQYIRCLLAVAFLFPVATLAGWKQEGFRKSIRKWMDPALLKCGLVCGSVLFLASSLQQIGLVYTEAGKAGFITAMYIVMVPLMGIALKRRPPVTALVSVVPAVIGLYLLCGGGVTGLNIGDLFLMCGALGFAVQIMLIDRLAKGLDSLRINTMQCAIIAVLSLPLSLTEEFSAAAVWSCRIPLLYAGVMSMGIAYSLQVMGQKYVEPTAASLIMSLESVFAALGGWLILKETMSFQELTGCMLMLLAVILSQIPVKPRAACSREPVTEE